MKPFHRILLGLGVALGAFFLLVLLAANLLLQSEETQERIRQATTASLGYPVEIGQVFFTPWGGLTLGKLEARNPQQPAEVVFMADSLRVHFAWWPLLSRHFVITAITLENPAITLAQNQKIGVLPPTERVEVALPTEKTPTSSPPAPPQESAEPAAQPAPQPIASPAAPPAEKPLAPAKPFFTVEVRSFQFLNGHLLLRDEAGNPALEIQGLTVQTHLGSEGSFQGKAQAAHLILGEALHLRSLEAPFVREKNTLRIDALRGRLAEGTLQGSLTIEESTQNFIASFQLNGASLRTLIAEATDMPSKAQGSLEAQWEMQGSSAPTTWQGRGVMMLHEARLEPLDFIKQVGELLRIRELQVLQLEEARAVFVLQGTSLQLENLSLASENLLIRSYGTIDLQAGELDLQARLLFNEQIQRNLGGLLSAFLSPSAEEGYGEIPFRVYGPASNPRTDLLDRLGAGSWGREVGRFLRGLFSAPGPSSSE